MIKELKRQKIKIMSNYKIILLLLIVNSLTVFSQKKASFYLNNSNARVYKATKDVFFKTFGLKKINEKGNKLNILFMNNPHKITEEFNLIIFIDHVVIYDGKYKKAGIEIEIPKNLLKTVVFPQIAVYKGNIFYNFSVDQRGTFIRDTDSIMHVIFLPENDAESIYINTLNRTEQCICPYPEDEDKDNISTPNK